MMRWCSHNRCFTHSQKGGASNGPSLKQGHKTLMPFGQQCLVHYCHQLVRSVDWDLNKPIDLFLLIG